MLSLLGSDQSTTSWGLSWCNGRSTRQAEVGPQQVEVTCAHPLVGCEVSSVVVTRVSLRSTERWSQDVKIQDGDGVIVVAIARPHQAHFYAGCRSEERRVG